MWIDSCLYCVFVQYYALNDILPHACDMPLEWFGNSLQRKNQLISLFAKMHSFINNEISGTGIHQSHVDIWKGIKVRFVCFDAEYYKHSPTIWVSTVKHTSPNHFLNRLLFSIGHCINETDFLGWLYQASINCCKTPWPNRCYCKHQCDHEAIPDGTRQFERIVSCAYECLTKCLLHNTMFADGMALNRNNATLWTIWLNVCLQSP